MASQTDTPGTPVPTLDEMQRWTWVIGRAQQLMMEHGVELATKASESLPPSAFPNVAEATAITKAAADFWSDGLKLWQRFLTPGADAAPTGKPKDKRFAAPEWQQHPMFDMIRQSYQLVAEHLMKSVDLVEGVDDVQREKMRFAARSVADAMSPSNFVFTNPEVMKKTLET